MARRSRLDPMAVVRALLRMRRNDPAYYDDSDPDVAVEVLHEGTWHLGVLERWRRDDGRWLGFVRSSGAGQRLGYWVDQEHIRTVAGQGNGERSFPAQDAAREGAGAGQAARP